MFLRSFKKQNASDIRLHFQNTNDESDVHIHMPAKQMDTIPISNITILFCL